MRATRGLIGVALGVALVLTACGGDGPDEQPADAVRAQAGSEDDDGSDDGNDDSDDALVTVRGRGRIEAVPDLMTVQLRVDTHAQTANEALDQANGTAATVIMTLEEKGVAERDVQTTGLSLWPTFDDKGRITGYSATNSLTAKLRDLEEGGAIIDAVIGMGGDAVHLDGVSFSIEDTDDLALEARRDAVERAAEQAKVLAEGAGVELGPIRSIDEIDTVLPRPEYYAEDRAAAMAVEDSVPIEAGTQELSLEVEVVYELAA